MDRFRLLFKKDGWLFAALLAAVILCLLLGTEDAASATPEEKRLGRVLSAMEGAGQVEAAIHLDANALPCGAVVVADGADSVAVRLNLIRAVSALLGVEPGRVEVFPREGGLNHGKLDP